MQVPDRLRVILVIEEPPLTIREAERRRKQSERDRAANKLGNDEEGFGEIDRLNSRQHPTHHPGRSIAENPMILIMSGGGCWRTSIPRPISPPS